MAYYRSFAVFAATIILTTLNELLLIDTDVSEASRDTGVLPEESTPAVSITTKVLLARTVSQAELPNVISDVKRINSHHDNAADLMAKALSLCNNMTASLRPYKLRHTFPNRILCRTAKNINATMPNFFASVQVDHLLFARTDGVAKGIVPRLFERDDFRDSSNIDVIPVSAHPVKIWNWITYLDEKRLEGYDYLWMADGDVIISSLNWQAFWQQVHLLRPKICQPSIIGFSPQAYSTAHSILQYHPDARVMASETAIVELMTPLFEVNTWLGYRNVIRKEHEKALLSYIKNYGEDCFDITWCHYARAKLKGEQSNPRNRVGYNPKAPSFAISNGTTVARRFHHRSCVVLYQTPVVHGNKKSLKKANPFKHGGRMACLYFRTKYKIHWAVETVYEVFTA